MKTKKIVVVDTGIFLEHNFFLKYKNIFKDCYAFDDKLENIKKVDYYNDIDGHGTAVNSILCRHVNNALIYNILTPIENEMFDENILIKILEFIYDNLDCDIINLSCGVTQCYNLSELYDVCKRLSDRGIIIVSAFDNNGMISYPAAFDVVIGVDLTEKYHNLTQFDYYNNCEINIRCASIYQSVPSNNTPEKFEYVIGSSFAAPYITSIIASTIDECNNINDAQHILKNISTEKFNNILPEIARVPFTISRAIVLPFNKEIHSLIRFYEMLNFEIVDIYDSKYLGNVGKCTNDILNINLEYNFYIKNIDSIDWSSNSFDTVIMGHFKKIDNITKKDYTGMIIQKCNEYKKNLYAFDNMSDKNINNDDYKIFYNNISKKNLPVYKFSKLKRFGRPILAVLGTSSRQGKYTLQLELRKRFINNGYIVGQLGTEPSSCLFGFDEIFPFGYDSGVKLDNDDFVLYLNSCIARIEQKSPDIIIIGNQSQTINSYWGNLELYPFEQNLFLLACEPDIYLLCINAYDEIDYIERTIKYINSLTCAKLIGLVIFPVNKKGNDILMYNEKVITNNELNYRKEFYENNLHIETYLLNNLRHIDDVYQKCINILSDDGESE